MENSDKEIKLELFKGHTYSSFLEMGKEVYLYPGRFYSYFHSPHFLLALSRKPELYKQYLALSEKKEIPDVFLFHMSYILNPYMSLRYHHFIFHDYEELGEQMREYGPVVDVYLKDLLVYHLLSEYMEKQGDDHRYPELYQKLTELEKEAVDDENTAYWKLMYVLTKKKTLYYDGQEYKDPEEFFASHLSMSSLLSLSSSLEGKLVLVYLDLNGYSRKVTSFEATVSSYDQQEKAAKEKKKEAKTDSLERTMVIKR